MADSASARGFLERTGGAETYRTGWAPGLSLQMLPIHNIPLAPPLPRPSGLLPDQGSPPPDRGATQPWPWPAPSRIEEEE